MVNDQELKAGHPPATKVGGARRRTRSKGDSVGGMAAATVEEPEQVEGQDGQEGETNEKDLRVVETDVVPPFKENTVEAVKAYHEKPVPSKNVQIKNPALSNNHINIQQPRK